MHGRAEAIAAIMVGTACLLAPAELAAQDLAFLDVPERPRSAGAGPSAGAQRGLAELERELRRFDARSRGYRAVVDQLLMRRERAERRAVLRRYASGLRTERRLEGAARARAIRTLTRFVAAHPDSRAHTPSALLRLAELTVERDLEAAGDERPALSDAVAATRRIVVEFPDDPRVDRASYLLGWALTESGRAGEAVEVWRAYVCANRFRYPAATAAPDEPEAPRHPAVDDDRRLPAALAPGPYADCRAPRESALTAEMWLRIGEHHFDASELEAAVDAYRRVVDHPDDRLFAFGLYKLAWSHYRTAHYPEAVERFAALVRYSDDVRHRTGAAGSDLREEALQYLALTLAYDDWNEDGRPDHTQGGPHPLERLEDPTLWPHAAGFAPEVYRRVGDVLFEMGHADEAVLAWRLRLATFEPGCDAPDVYLSMVRAQRQLGDEDAALATLDELSDAVGRPRWGSHCAEGAARAESLVRRALIETARLHHRRAQRLRERARVDGDDALEARARDGYGAAERVYASVLARFPNHPDTYQVAYDRAEALYWSGRYGEAARAYAQVRDSPFDDRLFARSARRVVESLRRRETTTAPPRTEPAFSDGAPQPLAIPEALQPAARAREIYVRWVRPREDEEHVRDAFAFNNARLLYLYGHWEPARERFEALFEARCRGPRASEVGLDAWRALEDMAVRREDLAELERLTGALRRRACTFSPTGPPALARGCESDASLACEVPELEARVRFRRLRAEADALDRIEDRGRRRAAAERIAARLLNAVDRAPDHAQAGAALLLAARLLDQGAQRPAAASAVYQRIVDELAPRDRQVEGVVAEAHFQLARAAQRAFDYERALASYATIVDSERFRRSDDPTMAQRRRDALVNAALLTARLGRHADSARMWERAADALPASEAREARLRAAEEALRAGRADEAVTRLTAWLRSGDSVRARWSLARAHEAAGREAPRRAALEATLEAHDRGAEASAVDRVLAARAALAIGDARAGGGRAPLDPGPTPDADAFARALTAAVQRRTEAAAPRLAAYRRAIALGHPETSVAALERQGGVYEQLVRDVLAARVEPPRDLTRRLRRASPAVREEARARFREAVVGRLDALVRPIECRAVERYAMSSRLATRAALPTLSAQRAATRLAAYGEERVRQCLEAAHDRDPSFEGFVPGELSRARAGLHAAPSGGLPAGRLAD